MYGLLQEKISAQSLRVGVIGLGYVGLPLAVTFAEAGFQVTGIDVSEAMIEMERRDHFGSSFIHRDMCEWHRSKHTMSSSHGTYQENPAAVVAMIELPQEFEECDSTAVTSALPAPGARVSSPSRRHSL